MNCSVLSCLKFVKSEGINYKQQRWNSKNELMDIFNHRLPKALEKYIGELSLNDQFKVYARSGSSGLWSDLLYVAFLDKKLSHSINGYSPSFGIYPIIMVSPDCQNIYLMYMVAIGAKTAKELESNVLSVRDLLKIDGLATDVDKLNFGKDVKNYKLATVCYTELDVDNYKSDLEILIELKRYFKIHEDFKKTGFRFNYRV